MNDDTPKHDIGAPVPADQSPQRQPAEQSRENVVGKPQRLFWGNYLARVVLVALALVGLFFSIVPSGRAALRAVMVLPGFVAARPLAPVVASGEPIRHVSFTITSKAGPVYLDVWEPTTAAPPIPGARQG